jgi:hypothetical protein
MLLWAILVGVLAWVLVTLLFLGLVYASGDRSRRRARV